MTNHAHVTVDVQQWVGYPRCMTRDMTFRLGYSITEPGFEGRGRAVASSIKIVSPPGVGLLPGESLICVAAHEALDPLHALIEPFYPVQGTGDALADAAGRLVLYAPDELVRVNGQQVDEYELKVGDVIAVGATEITIDSVDLASDDHDGDDVPGWALDRGPSMDQCSADPAAEPTAGPSLRAREAAAVLKVASSKIAPDYGRKLQEALLKAVGSFLPPDGSNVPDAVVVVMIQELVALAAFFALQAGYDGEFMQVATQQAWELVEKRMEEINQQAAEAEEKSSLIKLS